MTEYRLKIVQDDDPWSPREWDNLGTMAFFHKRYNLGDTDGPQDVEGAIYIEESDQYISLPVYMYDHSGITISTSPFGCRWDSGKLGIIYVSKQDIKEEYGDCSEETVEKVLERLNGEVETYDQYLRGDIWGYVVEKSKVYTAEDGDQILQWETVDSCWGFFGYEEAESEGQAMLESFQEESSKDSEETVDI